MKNKLIFRIIGALASALIVVSVFIPFVSVTGYSQSLWQANESVGTLYLPIMIIVFGVIGIVVFSTGFKTELAYSSAGALVFFLILQTIPIIDQNSFNTLSIGYYGLVLGVILIILMAFLCGLRVKQKNVVEQVVEQPQKELSMIDQIDKLYNDNSTVPVSNELGTLDNVIQPLPIGDSIVNPIPVENTLPNLATNNNIDDGLSNLNTNIPGINPNEMVNPAVLDNSQNLGASLSNIETNPSILNSVSTEATLQKNDSVLPINPMQPNAPLESLNSQSLSNSNPVIAEFDSIKPADQTQQTATLESSNLQPISNLNPVVAQFTNESSNSILPTSQQSQTNTTLNQVQLEPNNVPTIEPLQPLSSEQKIDVMSNTQNNTSNLDIFG